MTGAPRRMRVDEVMRERFTPGVAVLLFLTDRCPVGCAHCSVDSRRDSPTITDYDKFAQLVEGICADPASQLVGISGGEPFVERRGLTIAMHRLAEAGKDIVLYTSGVWARAGEQPAWIRELLPLASCVMLSTDGFHQKTMDETRFVAAARAIADAGVPVIVQVLDTPDQVEEAERLLTTAFGSGWPEQADLSLITPLPYGRGADLFARPPAQPGRTVGACKLLSAPVVRYDGRISACCNEPVIMGRGPERLRETAADAEQTRAVLDSIRSDALLGAIATVGAGAVTAHPDFEALADTEVHGLCDLCWRLQDASKDRLGSRDDLLLTLMPMVTGASAR
ncbi:MAG: radical SAM protein [Jatrophihabitantaceae bacterium]